MNEALWDFLNWAGWWYWIPAILLSLRNLYLLSMLSAPGTGLGRAARVFAWLAHLPMIFTPAFNALGSFALPLMLVANNLLYHQLRDVSDAAAPSPTVGYGASRMLSSMVDKK